MAAEIPTAVSPSLAQTAAAPSTLDGSKEESQGVSEAAPLNIKKPPGAVPEAQSAQVDGAGDKTDLSSTADPPVSPAASKSSAQGASSSATTGPVPLDSPLRTTPIHPSIPGVKVPVGATDTTASNINPLTLAPFTEAELQTYGYEKLRASLMTPGGGGPPDQDGVINVDKIREMKEETALLLKQKIEEREAKIREIEKEMEEKEKIREVERKIFRKKLGKETADGK